MQLAIEIIFQSRYASKIYSGANSNNIVVIIACITILHYGSCGLRRALTTTQEPPLSYGTTTPMVTAMPDKTNGRLTGICLGSAHGLALLKVLAQAKSKWREGDIPGAPLIDPQRCLFLRAALCRVASATYLGVEQSWLPRGFDLQDAFTGVRRALLRSP